MVRPFIHNVSVLVLAAAMPMAAQEQRPARSSPAVPPGAIPPAGLCRVWLKDVPAGQQPAPTDCATAIRKAPATATILFGDLGREAAQPVGTAGGRPSASFRRLDDAPRMIGPVPGSFGASQSRSAGARRSDSARGVRNTTVGTTAAPVNRPTVPPPPKLPEKLPEKPPEKPQS